MSTDHVTAPTAAVAEPWVRRWPRRTRDRLRLVLAVTLFGGILAAATAGLETARYTATLDQISGHDGQLAAAAADVSRSLADADTTAALVLLAGEPEPVDLRDRYLSDIAATNAALSTEAADSPTTANARVIASLANDVPTYTGLIETARADNRRGLLLGAAYQDEASDLLRTHMLPAARRLYQAQADKLSSAQATAGSPPVVGAALFGAATAWLILVQLYLRRLTRRMLNLGLLLATFACLAATGYLFVAGFASAAHSTAGWQDGSRQVTVLADIRITAVQASGDEALTLLSRGNAEYDSQFDSLADRLAAPAGLLNHARSITPQPDTAAEIDAATALASSWTRIHKDIADADESGDYPAAVRDVIGDQPNSAAKLAAGFDARIAAATEQATARFTTDTDQAQTALAGAQWWVNSLSAIAIVAAVSGLRPRLAEYR